MIIKHYREKWSLAIIIVTIVHHYWIGIMLTSVAVTENVSPTFIVGGCTLKFWMDMP